MKISLANEDHAASHVEAKKEGVESNRKGKSGNWGEGGKQRGY